MFDAVAIPGLALLVVAFLVYIWVGWLKDKDGRALTVSSDDEADDPASRYD
jgi:hypothetical protein